MIGHLVLLIAVKYKVKLFDDTIVTQTPEEGVEFYMKDGKLTVY